MKVGTSLSRCILDIYQGKVPMEEVLVIVARTKCDNDDDSWQELWEGYRQRSGWSNPEWEDIPEEDEPQVRQIYSDLFDFGKLHQPRKFGVHPQRMREYWYDVVLTSQAHDDNPLVKEAFEQYQMVAGLINGQSA